MAVASSIWWLALGTATGTITSSILYCIGNSFGSIKEFVRDYIFQQLAKQFDISAHTFRDLANMKTFPRLLQEIGLCTYEYMWLHEANASANDSVQHGYIRMPTKSLFVKCLAFCHVSHFIYIKSDLQTITIVGPTACVNAFIKMSNVAATRRMTCDEMESLKKAFGCGSWVTDVDLRFIKVERWISWLITFLSFICTGNWYLKEQKYIFREAPAMLHPKSAETHG